MPLARDLEDGAERDMTLEIAWYQHGRALRAFVDGCAADLSAILLVLRERRALKEKRVPRQHRLRVDIELSSDGRWRPVVAGTSGNITQDHLATLELSLFRENREKGFPTAAHATQVARLFARKHNDLLH